jgi:AcrR family transcriptional regulator
MIVDEAIRFFAEVGFEGQTRALAERLGVTQPLLYRYFPDKDALIERVYQEVFMNSWDPAWTGELRDRSLPLRERIIRFYRSYTRCHFRFVQVRLFMYAGLKDPALASRYLEFIRDNLFVPLCLELRADAGLPVDLPAGEYEIECAAALHGAITYIGVRRWVYHVEVPEDTDRVVANAVDSFLNGMSATLRSISST